MRICIIGAGATGLLLLLLLQGTNANITIIDPHFDGGDLMRRWTAVKSNIPWSKVLDSLRSNFPNITLPEYDPASIPQLADVASMLRTLAAPTIKGCHQIQGHAVRSNYDTATQLWTTEILAGGVKEHVVTEQLIFTQGSEPRTLDLPIPSIPLEVALDLTRMKHFVKAGQKVIIFGTMHSGALVAQNAVTIGAEVVAYYNTEKPFYWARDGAYDGIKEEAADIADAITAGTIPVTLVPVKDTAKVIRTSYRADWVIYAMGFSPRNTIQVTIDGVSKSGILYDGLTGRLTEAPAWGFGVAYPNRAPDGIHWDVSVPSFLNHMKQQISNIVPG
jgi:hypothetical protein